MGRLDANSMNDKNLSVDTEFLTHFYFPRLDPVWLFYDST